MSSITTRQGDSGETRLYSGETVSKKSKRVWACGDIDELVSMLGIAYANIPTTSSDATYLRLREEIVYIQRRLFALASEIATLEPKLSQLKEHINIQAMEILDKKRDTLEAELELPKGFILPGANIISANLDMTRAISRRCERVVTDLYNEGFVSNRFLLMWMNRLSDYLYLLARYCEHNSYNMVKE